MHIGACYYPEHWPEERWPLDARLMREAGLNIVRIAEFAWSKLEHHEGEYDFSWLDRSMGILESEGIKVVLCTPTATPPKWLMDKHPDLYMRDHKGVIRGFGNRRHYCFNNPNYPRYARIIIDQLADRYGSHPNVVAWQIDNEFGCNDTTRCYCDYCKQSFREWLEAKYGDIDQLNESWGTVFWSQIYNSWNEIELPAYTVFPLHNPGMELDYRRFASDSVVRFQRMQVEWLREKAPHQPITHNLMGFFNEIDGYALTQDLDFVSWDNYPNLHFQDKTNPRLPAIQHDMTRGLKRMPFWVMEHQCGSPGGNFIFAMPKPGELRRWTWQSVAHGAEAILYFRWRTCLFGAEQYWHGILPHDGLPGRRYEEVKQVASELHRISPRIIGSQTNAKVALIRSYDNEWAMEIQSQAFGHDYMTHFNTYYRYFYDRRIPVDVVSEETSFEQYSLVVLPHFMLAREEIANKINTYVAGGGSIVLDFRSGIKRWDNRMEERTLPGPYRELLGFKVTDYSSLRKGEKCLIRLAPEGAPLSLNHIPAASTIISGEPVPLAETVLPIAETYSSTVWYDVLELETARPLAVYADQFIAGTPAATCNDYGQGHAYYLGMAPEPTLMNRLLDQICGATDVQPIRGIAAPDGIEITRTIKGEEEYLFVLNHGESGCLITLEEPLEELTGQQVLAGTVELPSEGVFVFARKNPLVDLPFLGLISQLYRVVDEVTS